MLLLLLLFVGVIFTQTVADFGANTQCTIHSRAQFQCFPN